MGKQKTNAVRHLKVSEWFLVWEFSFEFGLAAMKHVSTFVSSRFRYPFIHGAKRSALLVISKEFIAAV